MSDHDRGAYAPESDAPLAFDPRQERGGGPAPFSLIVSVVVLLMIVGGAYLFYRHGVRKAGEAPQVVGASIVDTRSAPPAGAQSSDESAGLQVYKTEAPSAAAQAPATTLAPPPEQPQPLPAARPEPVAVAPLQGEAAPSPAASAPPPPTRVVRPAAPAAKAAPVKVAAAKPPALRGPTVPDTAAAQEDSGQTQTSTPAPKPAKAAQPSAPADAAAEAPAKGLGGALVQIGAFADSAQADKTWGEIARAMPTQMHGKTRKVEAATKDGKTFYRAYVGGFASRADAVSFCASLKAAAKPCFVK